MKALKTICEEQQLKIDYLKNAVDNNAKVIVEFAEENDRLKKELAYKDELLQSVLEDLDDACDEVAKLEDRCENMVQEINDADDKINALSDDIANLCGDNDTLKCELLEARTDLADARNKVNKLEYWNNQLELQLSDAVLNSNTAIIRDLVMVLKANGVIPQNTELKI